MQTRCLGSHCSGTGPQATLRKSLETDGFGNPNIQQAARSLLKSFGGLIIRRAGVKIDDDAGVIKLFIEFEKTP